MRVSHAQCVRVESTDHHRCIDGEEGGSERGDGGWGRKGYIHSISYFGLACVTRAGVKGD